MGKNICAKKNNFLQKAAYLIVVCWLLCVYFVLNYYIGISCWNYTMQYLEHFSATFYWIGFWMLACSYVIARLGGKILPAPVVALLTKVGAYWLAVMFYLILIYGLWDIGCFFFSWLNQGVPVITATAYYFSSFGKISLTLVGLLLVYGSKNAKKPIVNSYRITISKRIHNLQTMNIAVVSDLHLGDIIDKDRLKKMVEMVNELNPDLVLMPGDIIDEDTTAFNKQNMGECLSGIKAKWGVYAVPGNHEYLGGNIKETVLCLEKAGIKVLRDEWLKVEDLFYIIGRDDPSGRHFQGNKMRKNLREIMRDIDETVPMILLNHRPIELTEALQAGVDLQVSGHTHKGQIFPNQFITSLLFEQDWGYYKKDSFQLIVSSGFGTWGPPIRIGNKPEIVNIMVTFNDSSYSAKP